MGGELIPSEGQELTELLEEKDLGQLLRPLTREIYLFDTNVAGTSYLKDPSVLERIRVGDRLTLRREDNKFDKNAILVLTEGEEKIGYIPERDNLVFSRLMDAGKLLLAKIQKITPRQGYTQINIGIFLVDF